MRTQELNLLMVFDAIMTENSITKAAERLNMTQPAVSNAVSRMRHMWKDDLFVKDGRKIQPTIHAQDLWSRIRDPLKQIVDAIDPDIFDPSTSTRTFRIAAADGIVDMAWIQLRSLIEEEAPGISIHTVPYNIVNGERVLNDAEVDLLITASVMMPSLVTSEFLYDSGYVCVMRPGHLLAKGELTLEGFTAADHLLISLSGNSVGFTDQILAEMGLSRKVAVTVNNFASAGPLIANSNLIGMIPSMPVESELLSGTLIARKPPIDIERTRVSAYWHKRSESDPGILWLREKISYILRKRAFNHQETLSHFCK